MDIFIYYLIYRTIEKYFFTILMFILILYITLIVVLFWIINHFCTWLQCRETYRRIMESWSKGEKIDTKWVRNTSNILWGLSDICTHALKVRGNPVAALLTHARSDAVWEAGRVAACERFGKSEGQHPPPLFRKEHFTASCIYPIQVQKKTKNILVLLKSGLNSKKRFLESFFFYPDYKSACSVMYNIMWCSRLRI